RHYDGVAWGFQCDWRLATGDWRLPGTGDGRRATEERRPVAGCSCWLLVLAACAGCSQTLGTDSLR
ncbi:MAG TPA: hypothetical protein VFW03_02405, partial [Gemmatimonadaceae bacterium]|nr:hypothetical protein [Gemmatimonadaceae bacterium]